MKTQNFKQFNKATTVLPQRTRIVIPAFSTAVPIWTGASQLLTQFNLGNADYYLSLKLPIETFGENFVLAARYFDADVTVRFKIWDHDDDVLYYPIYSGEKLGLNAVLEVWSVDSDEVPMSEEAVSLESSVLTVSDECHCVTPVASEILLTQSTLSTLPAQAACNPFCFELCEQL